MVDWMKARTWLAVRVARAGDHPLPGTALIADSSRHLAFVSAHSLGYTPEPRYVAFRPSIDVFFQSIVRHWKGSTAAVLLTGMGRDGAVGLKELRDRGALTIAQDSATSVVYGMPKAAAELKAAERILPLERIAGELGAFFRTAKAAI
jgi:chemotaxis response regulator CheB